MADNPIGWGRALSALIVGESFRSAHAAIAEARTSAPVTGAAAAAASADCTEERLQVTLLRRKIEGIQLRRDDYREWQIWMFCGGAVVVGVVVSGVLQIGLPGLVALLALVPLVNFYRKVARWEVETNADLQTQTDALAAAQAKLSLAEARCADAGGGRACGGADAVNPTVPTPPRPADGRGAGRAPAPVPAHAGAQAAARAEEPLRQLPVATVRQRVARMWRGGADDAV